MNKLYLLILISSSILIGMEKKEVLEPDTKQTSVSFSPEALDKLALTQATIAALSSSISPTTPPTPPVQPLIPRKKFFKNPYLSPSRLPHRNSAPDIEAVHLEKFRQYRHLSSSSQDDEEKSSKYH